MASTLKVDQIETPSGVGNISFAQPISGDGSQLTGVGLAVGGGAVTAGDVLYHDGTEWTRLPKGTAAQVLKMNSGATAPEWGTDTSGIAVPASSAVGDILYYDGSNYVRLAKGTAGQQLAINAGATAPEWITASSGGGSGVWTQLARGDTSGGFVTDIDITPADFDLTYNTSQGNASDYDAYKLYTTLESQNNAVDYCVRSRISTSSAWKTSDYNHTVTGMMNAANYVHTKSLSQQNQAYWKPLGNQQSNNNPLSRAHQEFTMYRSRDEGNGVIINCLTSFHAGVNAAECGVFHASLYLYEQYTNGLKLYASSGDIKGAYTMYGIKGS
jgi:hypothetical protein